MQKLIVVVIFLAALGGLGYFLSIEKNAARNEAVVPDTVPDTTTPDPRIVRIQDTTPAYTIDVSYRHVGNSVIDAKIDARVQAAIDAFRNDIAGSPPDAGMRPYTFSGEAADVYVGRDFISERVNLYQDTGGAHGLPIVLTMNFDATNGEEVTLAQALGLIGKTLDQVSSQALSQLNQEFGESVFPEGAAPKAENYETFLIGPYNVVFIFQPYQVVAYAAGMPEIKFARLND